MSYAPARAILDAGCGTGYGAYRLAASGARQVIGVDIDPWTIRFAKRQYVLRNLSFQIGNLEHLDFPDSSFDLVVASNSLEHLHSPEPFLNSAARILKRPGMLVLAVPPIYNDHDKRVHGDIRYHHTNLLVSGWIELLKGTGAALRCFSHRAKALVVPDFYSHLTSRLDVDDFEVVRVSEEQLCRDLSIGAIFELKY